MKKICAIGLFVFLLLTENCFALWVHFPVKLAFETHFDGANFELYTIAYHLDFSNTISYFVGNAGPYPMPRQVNLDNFPENRDNITERLGGLPTDYNGETFTWIIQDQGGAQLKSHDGVVSGLRKVELSTNPTITGDPLNPTLSWLNSDPGVDTYRVLLFDPLYNVLDQWSFSMGDLSFTFPES